MPGPRGRMPRWRRLGRGGRGSRLWPDCLRSTAVRDDQDSYGTEPPVTPTDNDAVKMAAVTSPDVDVGDGLCTVRLSGGAPFGFRLIDSGNGLIVSKVRASVVTFVLRCWVSRWRSG